MVVRGEVWLVALDPTLGSEIQKTRPCVVVSPPELHDHLRTVIVAPMTTKSRPAPFRVPVAFARKQGLILLDQVRTVDKVRLITKAGAIADKTLINALNILQEVFAE
jgi:mRNA interferase MazF